MVEMLKPLFTLRALGLGWAVAWRSFLVVLGNVVIVVILGMIISLLGEVLTNIYNIIASIYMFLLGFMATGWAVMRIKDKL